MVYTICSVQLNSLIQNRIYFRHYTDKYVEDINL